MITMNGGTNGLLAPAALKDILMSLLACGMWARSCQCTEGFRACSWSKGRFTALMAFMMDAQKVRVDMGVYFPCPGPCDRKKASTVLPGGDALLLYRQ
ncbi:MAG: hypothetical protein K8R13_11925 [Methanococcoides sp.]|nr:hypothetical protein [Methanococcoides sp.]